MSFLTRLFGKGKKKLNLEVTTLEKKEPEQNPKDTGTTLRKQKGPELTAPEMAKKKDWKTKTLPEWHPGDMILDTYAVENVISGGMGHVYIAYHKKWNVKVAIKSPNEMMLSDRDFFARILREANSWTELGLHPNIAYCYFVKKIEDVPHIIVEYVDGGNLREWIEDGKCIDYRTNLDLAIQFCHGMEHAHSKGMIHRDIKPENILMTKDGILKITDFGLVRDIYGGCGESSLSSDKDADQSMATVQGLTTIGTCMGTAGYMAPEQEESAKDADERADIFSFGVCLYEMFCGDRPYKITFGEKQDAPDPVKLSRDDSFLADIAAVLEKCVQWEPDNRYQNFKEIRQKLSAIYKTRFGEQSPFEELDLVDLEADGLNNQGVSFFELGRKKEAVSVWQMALKSDPTHLATNYNYALSLWRDAAIPDDEAIRRLAGCENNPAVIKEKFHEFMACMHVERFDPEAARAILEAYPGKYDTLFIKDETGYIKNTNILKLTVSSPGHTGKINSVAMIEDSRQVISASADKTLRLWDLETNSSLRIFKGHTESVNSVAVFNDGAFAISAGSDKSLCLWELHNGQCFRKLEGHTACVNAVAVTIDGRKALSAGSDKTLRFWDLETGNCLNVLEGHTDDVTSCALINDGRLALSAGRDKTLRLWDLENGQCLSIMEGHAGTVNSVTISKDGRSALSASDDKTLRFWDLETGSCLGTMTGHVRAVYSVSMDAAGRFAVSGGDDDTIRLWDLETGRCLRTLDGYNGSVDSVFLSDDARSVAAGGEDNSVRVWQLLLKGKYKAPLQLSHARGYVETRAADDLLNQTISKIEILKKQGEYKNAYSLLYDTWQGIGFREHKRIENLFQTLRDKGRIKGVVFHDYQRMKEDHTDTVYALDATDSGRLAVSGGEDKSVRLWEVDTGLCIHTMKGHTAAVYAVSISRDGRLAVSGGEDKMICLWNLETGELIRTMEGHKDTVYSVSISADGRIVLSAGLDQKLYVWETETGQVLRILEGHTNTVYSVAMTSDSRIAVSGGHDKTIRIWDIETGQCLRMIEDNTGIVGSLCVSENTRFAVSWQGNQIKLWDLTAGSCLHTMKGHGSMVNSVAITADGRFAISGGSDNKLLLWDLKTGQCLRSMEGHTNPISSVFLNSNGMYALSAGVDQMILFWRFVWDIEFD